MFKRIKQNSKEFGFGSNTVGKSQRILNKDGSYNVNRVGLSAFDRFSFFHWMINTSWPTFFLLVVAGFFLSSAIFAFMYDVCLGVEHFHGIESATSTGHYLELFFFSAQTSTTVGYGRINPATHIASFFAVLDALSGVLYFAIVTGLLYGRFSKPVPRIIFSEKGVVAPYKDGFAVMFRIANKLNQQLQNAQVRLIVSMITDIDGQPIRQFYELEVERKEIIYFATSWTIVHPIDDKSPFFQMSKTDFENSEPEFVMQLKVYDNSYSQDVYSNTSYRKEEIIWNARFEKILVSNDSYSYIDLSKFNDINHVL